jgi:hypothetical protein
MPFAARLFQLLSLAGSHFDRLARGSGDSLVSFRRKAPSCI